jgi:hypothetical protein
MTVYGGIQEHSFSFVIKTLWYKRVHFNIVMWNDTLLPYRIVKLSSHYRTLKLFHTEIANKMRQCIKIYYSMFIWSSTCFGRHTAHHQELKTTLASSGFAYVKGCWTLMLLEADSLRFSQNAGYFQLRKLLLLKEDSGPSVRRQVLVNYTHAAVVLVTCLLRGLRNRMCSWKRRTVTCDLL